MAAVQVRCLRRELHGRLEGRRTAVRRAHPRRVGAAGAVRWGVWRCSTSRSGALLGADHGSAAAAAGAVVYARAVLALRIPEAHQIERLLPERYRRGETRWTVQTRATCPLRFRPACRDTEPA